MAEKIIMPKAGSEMVEGEIVKWFKKEGEQVKEGELLLEIVTDKVNMELEAETSGVLLKILAKPGDVVPVVSVIGWIGEEGEEIPEEETEPEVKKENKVEDKEEEKSPVPVEVKKTEEKPAEKRKGEYDVCVIGGGPAGYVAAIKAAQLGGKVALVEKDEIGGTCLNRGCIPTKAYLHNAEIIFNIKDAASRGINLENTSFKVDMDKTVKEKNKIVKTLTGGVGVLLKSHDIKVFKGEAKIDKDKKVVVSSGETIDADKIILAGGSKAYMIDIPGIDNPKVLNSDQILDLKEIPEKLAVIGGSVIACELGQVFAAFGSEVTIVIRADKIIRRMDKDLSPVLTKRFEKDGIIILNHAKPLEIKNKGKQVKIVIDGKEDLVVDKVLVSTGRIPDLSAVENLDIEMEKGRVKVNDRMETSIPGVYAPGDINGIKMLAHAAFRMGEVAAENAMGHDRTFDRKSIPNVIYTIPEVASVGLTEEEAKEKYDIKIGRFNFGANGRALAADSREGFVKVIMDTKYHEILGVHIIGPSASEIINEASTFIQSEFTIEDAIEVIHGHPTFSEALYEACTDCLDICIHAPKKKV
ncbi:MAG: dihydrolipoyl dehydrogenase [Clostridiales bacterium]|nr:MAG: dihydrolipoyl dehydrogenase [Clostridiales bacterium]